MRLPYDYSLSHHQLLFNVFTLVLSGTNMEILFPKSKQNDKFTEVSRMRVDEQHQGICD